MPTATAPACSLPECDSKAKYRISWRHPRDGAPQSGLFCALCAEVMTATAAVQGVSIVSAKA